MKVSVDLSESDIEAILRDHFTHQRTEYGQVDHVHFSYDRPANPTPNDQGTGLSVEVTFK